MHADPIEVDPQPEQAAPHYKPMWARWLAVFVCVTVGVTAAASPELWHVATASFVEQREQWEKVFAFLPNCGEISRPGRFVQRWYTKFLGGDYTLEDAARSGRPRLLSLEEAQRAAAFVKKGRWVKVKARKGTHHRLVYFTSIQDAVDHTPELKKILDDNQISVAQLRAAMHAADPDLVRRRITFKCALSKEEKEARVKTAQELIQQYERDTSFLQNMIFIDETSIVLQGGGHEHVAVWCDKHDVDFVSTCAHCLLDTSKSPPKSTSLLPSAPTPPSRPATALCMWTSRLEPPTSTGGTTSGWMAARVCLITLIRWVVLLGCYKGVTTQIPCSRVVMHNRRCRCSWGCCNISTYSSLLPCHSAQQWAKLGVNTTAAPAWAAALAATKAASTQLGLSKSAACTRRTVRPASMAARLSLISLSPMSAFVY